MMKYISFGFLVILAASCGQPSEATVRRNERTQSEGGAYVAVQGGLSSHDVHRIRISAQPANTTQELSYNPNSGAFEGYLVLPPGQQEITATAYTYGGAEAEIAGTGKATVTIPPGGSASVSINIIDASPRQGQDDIPPMITAFSISKVRVNYNESVDLAVEAVDVDGDALAYSWSDDCGGAFADSSKPQTTWKKNGSAACTVKIVVTSGKSSGSRDAGTGFSDSRTGSIQVLNAADGTVTVSGQFVSRPEIWGLRLSYELDGGRWREEEFYRRSPGRTFRDVPAGQKVYVETNGDYTTSIVGFDNCGGTSGSSSGSRYFDWTAPITDGGAACKLTVRALNGELDDEFSVGVQVNSAE